MLILGTSIAIDPSKFKGDLKPVERVSYYMVTEWIEALNKMSEMGIKELESIIVGHTKGSKYDMPTEAQWEYVVRGRGKLNKTYHYGNDVSKLEKYAVYGGPDRGVNETSEVAKKLPLEFEGMKFYNMHGNVWEWTKTKFGPTRILRGGGWDSNAKLLESYFRINWRLDNYDNFVGFRLIRASK